MRYFLSNVGNHRYAVPTAKREDWFRFLAGMNENDDPPDWALRIDVTFNFRDPSNDPLKWDEDNERTFRYIVECAPNRFITANKNRLGPIHRAKLYQKSSDAIKAMKRWKNANLLVVEVIPHD